jgi:hypothetical protein
MSNKSKKALLGVVAMVGCSWMMGANALDEVGKRYIDRMAKGGPESVRDAAESIFQTRYNDPEVLDVAAEVLLQKYATAEAGFGYADSLAWICKALGISGNARYKAALTEVSDKAANRKLRGHCEKASDALPKKADASVVPYTVGMVNLEKYRTADAAPAAGGNKPAAAATSGDGKKVDFSLIREGMSSQEVEDLIGRPTSTSQRMTGKQFQPFNFGARDLQRQLYLYKGVGRIEFSLKSGYEGVYRVVSITANPNESGYP